MQCFQFSSFEFGARCSECGRYAKAHEAGGKFYCAVCCPACCRVKPFTDEAPPGDIDGEQISLF